MGKRFKLTKATPTKIIICGTEYAEMAKVKPLATVHTGEDNVFLVMAQPKGKRYWDNVGWASTDIADIAMCEYSEKLEETLISEQKKAPFMEYAILTVEDWQKQNNKELVIWSNDDD